MRACRTVHAPVGAAATPAGVHPAGALFDEYQHVYALQQHGVHVQEIDCDDPGGLGVRNCRQLGPERRGSGSMPAACSISHMVDGATVTPSFVSSPWSRRRAHSGFSFARRTTRRAMPGLSAGASCQKSFDFSYQPYPAVPSLQRRFASAGKTAWAFDHPSISTTSAPAERRIARVSSFPKLRPTISRTSPSSRRASSSAASAAVPSVGVPARIRSTLDPDGALSATIAAVRCRSKDPNARLSPILVRQRDPNRTSSLWDTTSTLLANVRTVTRGMQS